MDTYEMGAEYLDLGLIREYQKRRWRGNEKKGKRTGLTRSKVKIYVLDGGRYLDRSSIRITKEEYGRETKRRGEHTR